MSFSRIPDDLIERLSIIIAERAIEKWLQEIRGEDASKSCNQDIDRELDINAEQSNLTSSRQWKKNSNGGVLERRDCRKRFK
jgi:hypothetical protein